METTKIKVNFLDDHKIVTEGLHSALSKKADIEILDIAHSGEQLLSQLVNRQPDIIITDYSLTDHPNDNVLNGLETAIKVMALYPNIKILMMSFSDDPEVIIPCIESGIHGYILKGEKKFNIYNAVKQVFEEGQYFSSEITSHLARNMRHFKEEQVILAKREIEILGLLFNGKTAKEIGILLNISKRTVDNVRNRMLEKFDARNSFEMIQKALMQGILKVDSPH